MATKTADKAATQTSEEVGYQEDVVVKAPEAEVPEEILAKAEPVVDNYLAFLMERTEAYKFRMAEAEPEAGEPTLQGGYQYWNCLTRGPYQFFWDPPYRPSKIIAAGEWALMVGVVWINPANGPGGSLPGTTVLGDRSYRVRFETINLSDVSNGPDRLFRGRFASPAPVVIPFRWWFRPRDPGPDPNLYEVNLTADITQLGQPFAAFSTWHFDPDREPPFLGLPPVGPHWQHETPARFLVYRR